MLAQFSVLSRLKERKIPALFQDALHNGENLKDVDTKAKSIQEYRDYGGTDEGMADFHSLRTKCYRRSLVDPRNAVDQALRPVPDKTQQGFCRGSQAQILGAHQGLLIPRLRGVH
jgi:hypothetical protein